MKRVSWILFLIIGFVISFTACEEDDEPDAQPPSISSITPNAGAPGTAVTIAGSNFGTSPTVSFGSTNATVSSATNTSISTTVPGGLTAGAVDVIVTANGLTSTASSFTVEEPSADAPTITDFDPKSGAPGTEVTITGTNFSATASENEVKFGDAVATVSAASETELTVEVPNADQGEVDITVTVDENTGTSSEKFTIESTVVTITDADLTTETYEWTKDKTYLLDGLVFLEEGGVLNIEEGTVIKFVEVPTNGTDNTSALFITKGAKIMAEGTADEPIIFTSELDDLSGTTLTPEDNAKWGGLILLGKAPASKGGVTDAIQIEGIPSEEARGQYGGNVADDNSGILTYVSIRYTGIGFKAGDELQGLTLGGVGSGTTINYVDIFSSADDGIEIFGGTVNIRHISVAFSTDDDFDLDLGWRGTGQFLFSVMRTDAEGYDHAGEWDGASPDDAALYTDTRLFNCTFVGPGTAAIGKEKAILMRENFAGYFGNSILVDFPEFGIEVQDLTTGVQDCYQRLLDGEIKIMNNTWSNFNGATDVTTLVQITTEDDKDNLQVPDDPDGTEIKKHLTDNNNEAVADVVIKGISRSTDGGLDPRPMEENDDVATVPEGMEQVNYRGAFAAEGVTWLSGWSTLSKFGYLVD